MVSGHVWRGVSKLQCSGDGLWTWNQTNVSSLKHCENPPESMYGGTKTSKVMMSPLCMSLLLGINQQRLCIMAQHAPRTPTLGTLADIILATAPCLWQLLGFVHEQQNGWKHLSQCRLSLSLSVRGVWFLPLSKSCMLQIFFAMSFINSEQLAIGVQLCGFRTIPM